MVVSALLARPKAAGPSGTKGPGLQMVPTDSGSIPMKNPKAIQVELQKTTSHPQEITEVRQFGRGGILCCSADRNAFVSSCNVPNSQRIRYRWRKLGPRSLHKKSTETLHVGALRNRRAAGSCVEASGKPTTVAVEDMLRVNKPSVSFKGDISFSKPRKVIEQCGPASFILDDGETWNAAKLCKMPARRPGDNGLQQHSAGREYLFYHDPGDATLPAATWQPASAEASAPTAIPVPSADYDSCSPTRQAAGQFPASETVPARP
ncbi:hypothetical protein HPB51_026664 [Rhipicephalus microplus]|uniref:Uncharacterized protein n=1 Tax=Rhipicephalus microplus TaxID=6941 RepID=A0A9J6D2G2_RHIMP|nr:hypothetical protein HPB51_026664 [Rhipicephalus microplus]